MTKWQEVTIIYRKIRCSIHEYWEESVGFRNNIKYHGLNFHYNIKSYPMLDIDYISVSQITCSCSEYSRKLSSPWNIRQYNYNQVNEKVKNNSVFTDLSQGITTTDRLFIVLILENKMKQPKLT